jgi:hypothetical protein
MLQTYEKFTQKHMEQGMSASVSKIQFFTKFFFRFRDLFSRKMLAQLIIAFDALFFDFKRCSIDIMAKKTGADYDSLHYFFARAKWKVEDVNDRRLEIIQAQRTTRASRGSVLAIDDTAAPKPYAKKTDGAKYQYCGVLGRQEICNIAVFSAISSGSKQFPVDFRAYRTKDEFELKDDDPKFKSKIQIAIELFDKAVKRNLHFEAVVFDSWYSSRKVLEHIHDNNRTFICEIKKNRKIFTTPPGERKRRETRTDELVTLIKERRPHRLCPIRFRCADGKEITRFSYTFTAMLKNCEVPLKFIVIFGGWSKDDDEKAHVLICNFTKWSAEKILAAYLKRWGIEQIFRDLKDTFCFDQYQVRRMNRIERFWMVSILAWTAVYWVKQNGYLSRIVEKPPETFEQMKLCLRELAGYNRDMSLSKSKVERRAEKELGLKSSRFKNRARRTA